MTLKNVFLVLLSLVTIVVIIILYFYISANLPTILFRINPKHTPTKEEAILLQQSRRNPTNTEFQSLFKSMVKLAQETPYIEIGMCSPYPLFSRVFINQSVLFRNSDNKVHTIKFNALNEVSILPQQKKSVYLNFYKYVPVPYGYYCDDSKLPVGTLFVVEDK